MAMCREPSAHCYLGIGLTPCTNAAGRISMTARLDKATVEYFKALAEELDVPYQTLINLYLRDCAVTGRRPSMQWRPSRRGAA